MITPEYCQTMARYTQWMNERSYALLADMSDQERKRDRGAFFGSIHGTLNHLLWGDRMWLGRFIDEPCNYPAFGADMFIDFAELRRERDFTDQNLLRWAGAIDADRLGSTLRYTSKVDGRRREMSMAIAVIHLFNHGTHHRGQLTTLIKQAGSDPGVTDLPWLPGAVRMLD
jgi:uncharacterized damage-inducible protein DinB